MKQADFGKLERLNAQIDIWIDEENFDMVRQHLKIDLSKKSMELRKHLRNCVGRRDCTYGKDIDWAYVLNIPQNGIPLTRVTWPEEIKLTKADSHWSQLFWGKLLRAYIQEQGTDCYLRRLDEIVNYLEKHIPLPKPGDLEREKITVIYLLELSAAAQSLEQLGFAERAIRVMKGPLKKEGDFCDFYHLLARYNKGVAYFHEAQYRKAVIEFNKIIYQVKDVTKKREFFKDREVKKLLLLPAILYRADVQLKLQLAYHALRTLRKYSGDFKDNNYKQVRRKLIQVEACQQSGQLRQSWIHLREACKRISQLDNSPEILDFRDACNLPKFLKSRNFGDVKRRFIGLFIEYHLNRLMLEGEYEFSPDIARFVPKRKSDLDIEKYKRAVALEIDNIRKLKEVFSGLYFRLVRHNDLKRNGFYEQLAHYLAWLVRAGNHECLNGKPLPEIIILAKELYRSRKSGIMSDEEQEWGDQYCQYCKHAGIDLRWLKYDHYKTYTEDLFNFYDCLADVDNISKTIDDNKQKFVKKLLYIERKYRGDLRIRDLALRYRSNVVEEELGSDGANTYTCWKGSTNSHGFSRLLDCANGYPDNNPEREHHIDLDKFLEKKHYIRILEQWDTLFGRHLVNRSIHETHASGLHFLGLQRWNSSSPAKGSSVGGGYLIYHTDPNGHVDLGIAIDPGFDYVRNLFHMGFSLNDIDIVLISHAHIDHVRDFESIVTLLQEMSKRERRKRRIHVILTLGVYRRLEHIIEDPSSRYFLEPYIIDIDKEIRPNYFEDLPNKEDEFSFVHISDSGVDRLMDYKAVEKQKKENFPWITVKPTRAYHDDFSDYSDSFGFIIETGLKDEKDEKEINVSIGYTGDTKYIYPKIDDLLDVGEREIVDIMKQYTGCDAIIVHMGSLIEKNKNDDKWSFDNYGKCTPELANDNCESLVRSQNHPYLIGTLRLLSKLCKNLEDQETNKKPVILLSEFGEELRGGIRSDLVKRLIETYKNKLDFLPVDVGINVQLWQQQDEEAKSSAKVWCVQCDQFVPIEEADFERYGEDEALFCVCETCIKATPMNVLQERLRHLYEVGCELRTA